MGLGALSWQNALDAADLVASAQAATLPVGNLQDPAVSLPWRATGTTVANFVARWATPQPVRLVALFGLALAPTDTVRVRLSATASPDAADLLDTGVVACGARPGYQSWAHLLAAEAEPLSMRVDVSAPSRAALGFFDIGRAWAGPAWQPADGRGIGYGWRVAWQDFGDVRRTPGGVAYTRARYAARRVTCSWEALMPADAQELLELQRVAGQIGQVVLWSDPDSTELRHRPLLAYQDGDFDPITQPDFNLNSAGLNLLEAL